jgi:hypothetical protein
MVKNVKDEIATARKEGWNVLISEEIRPASEMFMPHISVIRLSDDEDAGDFYFPLDAKGKGRMTYSAMKKLAAEAGIQWEPEQEGIVKKEADYVAFRAVGRRFTSSGEVRRLAGFSDKDMQIKEDDLRSKEGQYKKDEKQIQAELRKERNFWMRKAESGARARVIKGFIPIKAAYTREEIKKPFMVLRYIFSPDMRDNFIKAQFLTAATQAVSGIYGPHAAPALPACADGLEPIHDADLVLEAPENSIPEAGDALRENSLEEDFLLLTPEEQSETIRRMIKNKNYDTTTRPEHLRKTADQYTAADRLELYRILSKPVDVGF